MPKTISRKKIGLNAHESHVKRYRRYVEEMILAAYGEGCADGHERADLWLSDPNRGRSSAGGTLQYVILDLARKFAETTGVERHRIRGEIVGFSYAIECPSSAAACRELAKARNAAKEFP